MSADQLTPEEERVWRRFGKCEGMAHLDDQPHERDIVDRLFATLDDARAQLAELQTKYDWAMDGRRAFMDELAAARARIAELEQFNKDERDLRIAEATRGDEARAEVKLQHAAWMLCEDRVAQMKPVVEAAMAYESNPNLESDATFIDLINAVIAYRAHPSPRDEEGK